MKTGYSTKDRKYHYIPGGGLWHSLSTTGDRTVLAKPGEPEPLPEGLAEEKVAGIVTPEAEAEAKAKSVKTAIVLRAKAKARITAGTST